MSRPIAYFVSSHGFGHAARAAAVIERLWTRRPDLRIELFTGTPRWFFEQSAAGFGDPLGDGRLSRRPWQTDVGLVQASALAEDMDATVRRLGEWLPLDDEAVDAAAEAVRSAGAKLVVCDVSPLGLAAAKRAGVPSVLVENFTWDWIYRGYGEPALEPFAEILEPLFRGADLRLKVAPFCEAPDGDAVYELPPVARSPRTSREAVRAALDVPLEAPLALVTMGGVPWHYRDLEEHLRRRSGTEIGSGIFLVVAGGAERPTSLGRARLIPHRSEHYHPDLVQAADAVVGKLGYSTVAEVARTGRRLAYVPRPRFPESPPLERWVDESLGSLKLSPAELEDGTWLDRLGELLERPALEPCEDGADRAAERILDLWEAA